MSKTPDFYTWRPHPWHGLSHGEDAPSIVNVYIELGPFDLVKYEVDKETGYLRIDRPHRSSSQHPSLYGFIPRTYCDEEVGQLMEAPRGGDQDPLDVCVISERPIERNEIILRAKVVGGLPMLDNDEADDKIIAVLNNDPVWAPAEDIDDLPEALIDRLRHYFLTYKMIPEGGPKVSIGSAYGREHAEKVVEASIRDYQKAYPRAT